ncbi:hypothetical protein MFLAVUS_010007 [Mucor flavus]|uniref:Uncharacterized protein n=1 Tax=Mucor flavus TaxID=439312 RepID=A0ABP9ZBH9_9FUNG
MATAQTKHKSSRIVPLQTSKRCNNSLASATAKVLLNAGFKITVERIFGDEEVCQVNYFFNLFE